MNEPEESKLTSEIENTSALLYDHKNIQSNVVDDSKIENNLNISNNEVAEDNDLNKCNAQKDPISSFLLNTKRIFIKEKPKVICKRDDDIEEFDTDDEDDNKLKQSFTVQNYSDYISYEGNKCIYTEPGTGRKLIWNSEENKWYSDEQLDNNPGTSDNMKHYEFDGEHYVYTDKTSNVTYKFIQEKNEWVMKDKKLGKDNDDIKVNSSSQLSNEIIYGFENDTHTYTDPTDGTSYIWDKDKNAWFPKVDDEFMARYQMSYGFSESSDAIINNETENPTKSIEAIKLTKEDKKIENKRKTQEPPTWFEVDEAHNTTIYISNLPLDITVEEIKELVTKCGLLARDEKGKDKLKLYTDSNGETKGDARCTYIKVESVNLALNILDGWQIRDKTLSVQRAKFQLKGTYNPALKPKRKKKDKDRQKKIEEKLFDWRPERMRGEPLKCERVVIIKNLFKPEDFDKDVTLLLEYQQDVRSECIKCGEVKKVTIYDRHPEGVAQVTFKEPEEAQACILLLNGRWFGQRKITAEIWDGKTKYKIRETEEQIEARINKWDKFLDDQEEAEEKIKKKVETDCQSSSS
ncbi:PREDICTED: HIV Tat-specific factor 1 homolog [Ceratosolen solmsi marchali]|uniref:HIV Tat-specific factor 1 homolog n=1 Tax=Ceratosolen solmsi marchali TaxID=326594 RepID=A0AAJ7E1S4_9HYME|nr:PREDICTED: HIV Tat-specific factor 1 homolog [Ceratosolen solmsi marchali]